MAQDITGTNLSANAQAAAAEPVARVLFDWTDLGFDDIENWTDETDHLVTMNGESRALGYASSLAAFGSGSADVAYITLDNPVETGLNHGLRFSPSNAGSSLYPYIGEGKVRMKRAAIEVGYLHSGAAERVRLLTGYVVQLEENYAERQVVIEVRDRAASAALSAFATTLQEDALPKDYIETLLALLDRDAPGVAWRSLDNGLCLLPYAWLEDESIWKELGLVAESQGGRIWYDHAGIIRFHDATYQVRAATSSWQDPLTSQFTFTVADFGACNPLYDPQSIANHVIVEYRPKYISTLQSVYRAAETFIVPAADSVTVRAEHRYPVRAITTPTSSTDFLAGTAGGIDITSDVTISPSSKATYTDLVITNANEDYAAYLYKLELRGYPLLHAQPIRFEVEDAASILEYGRLTIEFDNPYIASLRQAESLARFALARFKDPPLILTLEDVPALPWLEPGDRVTVQDEKTDLAHDFFIGEIAWTFADVFSEKIGLVRADDLFAYSDYFVLGTSTFGDGADATDGRLFW